MRVSYYRSFSLKIKQSNYLLLLSLCAVSLNVRGQSEVTMSKEELAAINRELDNPLAKRWSLVFQENFSINQPDFSEDASGVKKVTGLGDIQMAPVMAGCCPPEGRQSKLFIFSDEIRSKRFN